MGRPLGDLRGRTEQANKLAIWLRKVTEGVKVRQLEVDFPYGKSAWTGFRNGSSLIPQDLLEQVVDRYIHEPGLRARELQEGRLLLREARGAAALLEAGKKLPQAAVARQRGGTVAEAFLRLDDARLRQIEAMQKLAASEKRCAQLQDMVSVLENRCTQLEVEQGRAREEARAELQRELELSIEYRRQADEQLEHARRAQREAYEIRLAAEQQVARGQSELQQQVEDVPAGAAEEVFLPQATAARDAAGLDLPPLEQIADVLCASEKQLTEQDRELEDLREQVGLDRADRPGGNPVIVSGHVADNDEALQATVVRDEAADNADNPLTESSTAGGLFDHPDQSPGQEPPHKADWPELAAALRAQRKRTWRDRPSPQIRRARKRRRGREALGRTPFPPPPPFGGGDPAAAADTQAPAPSAPTATEGHSKLHLVGTALVGVVALFGVLYGAGLLINPADVPRDTTVLGVDIGGTSKKAAVRKLDAALGERATAPLKVTVDGEQHELKPSVAGLAIDTEATVHKAADGDYNPVSVIGSLFGGARIAEPEFEVDEEKLTTALETLSRERAEGHDGGIKFVPGEAVPVQGKPHKALNLGKAATAVTTAYRERAETTESTPVPLPVAVRQPTIDDTEIQRALEEFANPAMSGQVIVRTDAVHQVSFNPEVSLSKVISMKPIGGKLVESYDRTVLRGLYGSVFDGVLIHRGDGSRTPVTPEDVIRALRKALRGKTAAERIGVIETDPR
ncbi:hypothetical protein [Streptomyces sp. 4N124]|uniref:hypothetical protein n=1 Tax=Streptomyces sp. 4N124 TaxID=3457420 RepID=UPI003FD52A7D